MKPLVIVGPSGVGKMTLIKQIIEKYGVLFELKKSHTSRGRREHEKMENDHIFVKPEEFQKMIAEKAFIECRLKGGDWHGTSFAELERIKKANKVPIIEVDYEGAVELNK
jgi:guanylate kinase